MRYTQVCCFVVVLALCSGNDDFNTAVAHLPQALHGRIVGGSKTNIAVHPYMVSLRYKSASSPQKPFKHRCGGSIYSRNVIITAAHCVDGKLAKEFQICAGSSQRRGSDGVILPVAQIIIHEQYDSIRSVNDIALIFVAAPLPVNNFNIRSIALAEAEAQPGATAIVTGWGTTMEGGVEADILEAVRVPIISKDVCRNIYHNFLTESMLCAGTRGKDACQNDSGGPLVVNGKLTGVVSWGIGYGRPHFPGVYASISYLRPWILEHNYSV